MDNIDIKFVSASYLMDADMIMDIKWILKFKIKFALNKYEVDIQRIQIL
jgi:hypothetical protein